MKCARLLMLGLLGTLALLTALYPGLAQGQNNFVSAPNIPCGFPCPVLGPLAVQNAVFQNVFVFIPGPGETTWDQHLANFLKNNPQFGPPTPAVLPFVNCMDGTAQPCLQDLTSEAIDNYVRALVNSNYFQAMENSYNVRAPVFLGEEPLNTGCATTFFGGGSTGYWNIVDFLNCQFLNPNNSPPPQFNLIFAPDLPPPSNINGVQACVGSNEYAFHGWALSQVNLAGYLVDPAFQSGVMSCVGSTSVATLNPFGLFGVVNNCLDGSVASQCVAAALAGAVSCGFFDVFAPGLCETLDALYVATCFAEAGLAKTAEDLLANEFNFTAIPTNQACFSPSFLNNSSDPRQILGGAKTSSGAATGGVSSTLERVAVAISHEMGETITDPGGLGWVHPESFSDITDLGQMYRTGEIGDICEPGGFKDPSGRPATLPVLMPFLFLHVARYWSNADNQCMPQFDASTSNGFRYTWLDANTIPGIHAPATGNSVVAMVGGGATPISNGFWGNALSSPQISLPNVRVTDLGSTTGPAWDTTLSPPQQFGNSIDMGGTESTLSYSATPMFQGQSIQMVAPSPDDVLAVELWDSKTGQGCSLCEWPAPSPTCELAVQEPPQPPGAPACTVQFNSEALTYGLSEPPLDGNVIYTINPLSAGGVTMMQGGRIVTSCSAITPCALGVTLPQGSGSYTLMANDTVIPLPWSHFSGPARRIVSRRLFPANLTSRQNSRPADRTHAPRPTPEVRIREARPSA
jgi:hypothetical protein